jgi:hypothetical protein
MGLPDITPGINTAMETLFWEPSIPAFSDFALHPPKRAAAAVKIPSTRICTAKLQGLMV